MRIWSIHPRYLDAKGLVALWRETLLAKHVLENKTRGYKNHPQLQRFKKLKDPIAAINQYLLTILQEAHTRQYKFDANKISRCSRKIKMCVNTGQIEFEFAHLLKKLKQRDPGRCKQLISIKRPDPNPMFRKVIGGVEDWEII